MNIAFMMSTEVYILWTCAPLELHCTETALQPGLKTSTHVSFAHWVDSSLFGGTVHRIIVSEDRMFSILLTGISERT